MKFFGVLDSDLSVWTECLPALHYLWTPLTHIIAPLGCTLP